MAPNVSVTESGCFLILFLLNSEIHAAVRVCPCSLITRVRMESERKPRTNWLLASSCRVRSWPTIEKQQQRSTAVRNSERWLSWFGSLCSPGNSASSAGECFGRSYVTHQNLQEFRINAEENELGFPLGATSAMLNEEGVGWLDVSCSKAIPMERHHCSVRSFFIHNNFHRPHVHSLSANTTSVTVPSPPF
ncbi:unnamed protein product [Soboliphyme baturini]|uniref:Secreted protein n=1 Tax=Soboliphyme baturini TaxID=241478 RepID=A0A183IWF0_9BILA|nr:unnamed protein product [Soboliphyme baturini]